MTTDKKTCIIQVRKHDKILDNSPPIPSARHEYHKRIHNIQRFYIL